MPAAQQPVALNGEPEKRQQVPSWLLQVANPQQATTPAPATGAQQGERREKLCETLRQPLLGGRSTGMPFHCAQVQTATALLQPQHALR